MKDPIPFNDLERYIISYYRTPALSNWRRIAAIDGIRLVISLCFVGLSLAGHDMAWGVVGYLILVYVIGHQMIESRHWLPAIQGVIGKYEARIAELNAELERRATPPVASGAPD